MEYRRYLDYMNTTPMAAIQVFVIGLLVGFLVHAGTLGLQQYALEPLFCQQNNDQYCSNTGQMAAVLSILVFHFLGLVALVRIGVIRPLLVVIASIVTLYGAHAWLAGQTWWMGGIYSALLVGVAYLYFTWINRMTLFPVAIGLTVVSVIIARLLLSYW
jgi:hypothetical protein